MRINCFSAWDVRSFGLIESLTRRLFELAPFKKVIWPLQLSSIDGCGADADKLFFRMRCAELSLTRAPLEVGYAGTLVIWPLQLSRCHRCHRCRFDFSIDDGLRTCFKKFTADSFVITVDTFIQNNTPMQGGAYISPPCPTGHTQHTDGEENLICTTLHLHCYPNKQISKYVIIHN